ncbi:MAG: TetR/AcrR family transcriptional regulator [Actinomycetota bacterium]|nr:TetR/AcrR family transcriptional regulator [Actinomycetota bacterium]
MSTPTPRRRGRPRDPAVDDAILDAALRLFIEEGPDGATIERIAARAGVTRPTVYRRWKDRNTLLVEAIAKVREQAERPLGEAAPTSLAETLTWMTEAIPSALAQPESRTLLARLIGAVPDRPELLERYWSDVLGPRWSAFGALLQGSSPATSADAELLSDIVAGALVWRVLVRPEPKSEPEIREYLTDLLRLLGLGR